MKYANTVLKTLGISQYFRKVYGKEYCWLSSESLLRKDLQKLGFNLSETIFVDVTDFPQIHLTDFLSQDNPLQATKQQGNTIRIKKFKGEPDDNELLNLTPFLHAMSQVSGFVCFF